MNINDINIVRFMRKLRYLKPKKEQEFGCILWKAGKFNDGYGAFWDNELKKQTHAHRWIYKYLVNPDLPDNVLVRHTCDRKLCCNIAHHLEGTNQDNSDDMVERNRQATGERNGKYTHPESIPRGEKVGTSKLSSENVLKIRKMYATKKYTQTRLGKLFGINQSSVSAIIRNSLWKHL
jgi:hypothetical protein